MKPVVKEYPDIRWSYRASFPELCLTLEGPDAQTVKLAGQKVDEALGKAVFAREDINLPTALGKALREKSLTLATAESCTGGQIGHLITETPGSSEYFRGGIIAYNNDIKETLLGVNREILDSKGAVSKEVVLAMAEGVRKSLKADVGIAVSGIAGPTGGTQDKPVGLVHFAASHPNGIEHRQKTFPGYNRSRVKRISAWTAMWVAFRAIMED
jgi:nicotinamide-nucleotide amidase